jgi:hypothetical protein
VAALDRAIWQENCSLPTVKVFSLTKRVYLSPFVVKQGVAEKEGSRRQETWLLVTVHVFEHRIYLSWTSISNLLLMQASNY